VRNADVTLSSRLDVSAGGITLPIASIRRNEKSMVMARPASGQALKTWKKITLLRCCRLKGRERSRSSGGDVASLKGDDGACCARMSRGFEWTLKNVLPLLPFRAAVLTTSAET